MVRYLHPERKPSLNVVNIAVAQAAEYGEPSRNVVNIAVAQVADYGQPSRNVVNIAAAQFWCKINVFPYFLASRI
jgi:hypothetical protein